MVTSTGPGDEQPAERSDGRRASLAIADPPERVRGRHPFQLSLSNKFKVTFATVVMLLTGFAAARQVRWWPDRLRYPGELDSVEGRELADMVMLREGRPVYAPATPEQFNAAGYGPLYYLLGSHLIDPQHPSYRPLRELAMMGTLGLAAGCALLALWVSGSYLAAALAPLIFFGYEFVTMFGVTVRCDTVALCLWFGGFLTAYRFRDSDKILLAAPVMVLAFFYKGQFVSALLAVLLFLVLEKRFRRAVEFALLVGAGVVGLFLFFQFVVFRGQAFWLHALAYNAIRTSIFAGLAWLVILGSMLAVPAWVSFRYIWREQDKLLVCYLGWVTFLTPLMLSKMGSGTNYAFEFVLLLCALFASSVVKSFSHMSRGLGLLGALVVTLWAGQLPWRENNPTPVDFAEDRALQSYLRQDFPPHTPGLSLLTGDLLRAGLDAPIANLYQYSFLVCKGTLPESELLRQLRSRRFRVILYNEDLRNEREAYAMPYMCLTEPVRRAIVENYRLDSTFSFHIFDKRHYYAWVPR
jgi:hypothetical protein